MNDSNVISPRGSSALDERFHGLFEELTSVRRYKKGELIYRQGESAPCFCYLKKGVVRVFMSSVDGIEKTLNSVSKGELFGEGAFFDKLPRVSSAAAETACEVVMVDEPTLTRLFVSRTELAFELLKILSNRVRLLSSQLDSMTFLRADERIARLLLQKEAGGEVAISHEQIAEAIGATRVTVSKILGSFAKKGLIKTEYRKITLNESFYRCFAEK